jgi:cathepsin L
MTFAEFYEKFGRTYEKESEEYRIRRSNFQKHADKAEMLNCKRAGSTWRAGVNNLADLSEEELKSLRGYKRTKLDDAMLPMVANLYSPKIMQSSDHPTLMEDQVHTFLVKNTTATQYPESFTWGHLESMREGRDQSTCGSCWAFAAEATMRAHSEINGKVKKFSVEQILSCTPNPQECGGQGGCDGATAELAFEYVLRHGVVSTNALAYTARKSRCPASMHEAQGSVATTPAFTAEGHEVHLLDESQGMLGNLIGMLGWTKLPENKEEPFMRALVKEGPLAVAVSASAQWNFYSTGILGATECDPDYVISHAVVVFGYGIGNADEMSTRYWSIKNSWGSNWGEQGTIRLERLDDEEGHCGWDTRPSLGTGCIGGPSQVWVCGSCGILYDASLPHFNPATAPLAQVDDATVTQL